MAKLGKRASNPASKRASKALSVRELMSTELVTLEVNEDLELADQIMRLGRIRHLPVVQGEQLVGLVTHRDLLRAQLSDLADVDYARGRQLREAITAGQVMTTSVRTVGPDTTALEAAKLMRERKFGCLPVVQNNRLVGILTEADFLSIVIRALEAETEG